jgi:predicted GNAT family acetyltransferase
MSDIRDNPARNRFEMVEDGDIAFVAYRRDGNRIALTHTEVPEALAGQDIGSKLVRGVLDRLRAADATVVPLCELVAAYIERHPEYRDMVADVA